MPEQVQKILNQILEWWKKFNNKQRALIISIVAVVLIALGILAVVMSTPKTILLYQCENYTEAAQIKELLESDDTIDYSTSSNGLLFYVEEEDEATASMLLGSNQISTYNYSMQDVVDGSFTRTEADKQKLYKELLEKKFADHISQLSMVESCTVDLELPDNDGTILSKKQNATAGISLKLKGNMDTDQAYGLAQYVAAQLGNDSTEGITIIDQNAYILYNGSDAQTSIGAASTQLSFQQKLENAIKEEISDVLVNSHVFSNVEIAMNLDVNFDTSETVKTEIGIPQGMDSGAMTQQSLYDMTSTNGVAGGVPGTDSNGDDTTYVVEEGESGSTEISESNTTYDYDRIVTTIKGNGGDINYDNCSATVMATKYIVYDEAQLRAAGTLDDTTWEAFKAANSEARVVDVDDSYIQMVANATGFPSNAITFLCYEEPKFVDEIEETRSITDYAQIIIAVLIFALLGYVVFRSTRTQKTEELEPEISVETLLESTANVHEELEDIDYNEKSDVRVMIEKFVDENPEAVASLLRNWLNEDWE